MKKFATIFPLIILTACGSADTIPSSDSATVSQLQKEEPPVIETTNVSYEGIVRPAGISIYMEGTHRLSLSEGRFILLESDAVDLNGYVGEHANVIGSIRPTVESDGQIMRVESISLVRSSSSKNSSNDSADTEESSESSAKASLPSASSSSETILLEEPVFSDADVITDTESPPFSKPDPQFTKRIQTMSRHKTDAAQWTQSYCTAHIGFCIPVHRNWWFKSFGTTTNSFWHVELSSEPVEQLGDGPIVIELHNGTLDDMNISDASTISDKAFVTGYKEWTYGRHFTVTADTSLEAAVRYIVEHLKETE